MQRRSGWGLVVTASLLLAGCGRGPAVGAVSHPRPSRSPFPTVEPGRSAFEGSRTWWHAGTTKHGRSGFSFEVPATWDASGGDSQAVHLQGAFRDGVLPAGVDVTLLAPYGDSPRIEDREWKHARIEPTLVDGMRGEILTWQPGWDPDAPSWVRWGFLGIVRIYVDDRVDPFGVGIELTATDPVVGEDAIEGLLAGLDFHRERDALPLTPPVDELPSRTGIPELESVNVAKLGIRIDLPRGWFDGEPSPDRIVFRTNAIGNLVHFFARSGEVAVGIQRRDTPFDFWYDGEDTPGWEIRFDGSVETPAGSALVRVGAGRPPGPSGYCAGSNWLAYAYLEGVGGKPGAGITFSGCDTPEMEPLFRRILATLERTD